MLLAVRGARIEILAALLAGCADGGGGGGDETGESSGDGEVESGDGAPPPGECEDVVPARAYESTVAELGVPHDVRMDDAWASPAGPSGRFGSLPRIVVHANDDGSLDVAWDDASVGKTFVTRLCTRDGVWEADWHLDMPGLERLVGFGRTADGAWMGATAAAEGEIQYEPEPMGEHRPNIVQVARLDVEGEQEFLVDLRTDVLAPETTPIYGPLSFGTGVVAVGGGEVVAGFAQFGEYDAAVMSRHQWCTFVTLDATTGDHVSVWGGPSHCFDQKILWDGESFVGSALGDAGFRGIGLAKLNVTPWNLSLAVKGGDMSTGGGYQNTFTRLGDTAIGEAGYVQVFATESTPEYQLDFVNASRNLALVHLVPDVGSRMPDDTYDIAIVDTAEGNDAAVDFPVPVSTYFGEMVEGKNKGIVWLTAYDDAALEHAERPKLVRLGVDVYAVLWEKWTATTFVETMAMIVDEWGHVVREPVGLGMARLQRADAAVAVGGRVAWVVGEADGPRLVLHLLDAELELERWEIG
jgi:hypothetical protein